MNIYKCKLTSPSIRSILKGSFGLLFLFVSTFVFAQANTFIISGCDPGAGAGVNPNGNYTRNATDANGCPCYDSSNGGVVFHANFIGGSWLYNPSASCNSTLGTGGGTVIYLGSDCDISNTTASGCDPATTLILPSTADVPTLSEWGLIILALMFMTMGTLYLLQPNFRKSFERQK